MKKRWIALIIVGVVVCMVAGAVKLMQPPLLAQLPLDCQGDVYVPLYPRVSSIQCTHWNGIAPTAFQTPDRAGDVIAFYEQQLSSQGWKISSASIPRAGGWRLRYEQVVFERISGSQHEAADLHVWRSMTGETTVWIQYWTGKMDYVP